MQAVCVKLAEWEQLTAQSVSRRQNCVCNNKFKFYLVSFLLIFGSSVQVMRAVNHDRQEVVFVLMLTLLTQLVVGHMLYSLRKKDSSNFCSFHIFAMVLPILSLLVSAIKFSSLKIPELYHKTVFFTMFQGNHITFLAVLFCII